MVAHPLKYAGKSAEDKLEELQATLKKDGQDAVVLTFPPFDLLALQHPRLGRGSQSDRRWRFAIVPASGKAELFIDPAKIGPRRPKRIWRLSPSSAHPRPWASV